MSSPGNRSTSKTRGAPKKTPQTAGAERPATRRLRVPQYKSFRLSKRIKHPKGGGMGSFRLFNAALRLMLRNKILFGGIVAIYFVLSLVFVRGFGGGTNLSVLKSLLDSLVVGNNSQLAIGATLVGTLFSGVGKASTQAGGAYQTVLLIAMSLAIIWGLRHILNGEKLRIRDCFYRGMTPLVPFLLVLVVIGIQFIPMILASMFFGWIFGNGVAVTALEKVLWSLLLFLFSLWSLYMVSSSIFALYIVTLPDMAPRQALRSARNLVRLRRWTVLRRVIFLPVAISLLGIVIIFPIVMWLTPIADMVFYAMSMAAVVLAHTYMYLMYRELLK